MPKHWFEMETENKNHSVSLKFVLLARISRRVPETVTTFGKIERHLERQSVATHFVCLNKVMLSMGFG